MTRFSNLIKAVFERRHNQPEYLDVSAINERTRVDLGLLPMRDMERREAGRNAVAFPRERVGRDWLSISSARRGLI
ncbi:MAG: hypothetical protein CML24_08750 [Rhizobiales bacterium]|nr:hypothetical protein [Hyphomicrobiales bacterium]